MQLSRFTDYSIRVLLYTAVHSDRLVTLAEIADFYGVSLEHLRKVVHNLGKLGLLKTQRGKNGGMRLACATKDINIGITIAQLENNPSLIDCSGLNCTILPACGLPRALKKAQRAFFAELEQYTLQDMIRPECLTEAFGTDAVPLS
jgi:Rrf2 family nitric oxide-sensitive transcriptional repressor